MRNLWKRTDFAGKTTTFGYDTLHRLKSNTADATHPSLVYSHAIARTSSTTIPTARTVDRTYNTSRSSVEATAQNRCARGAIGIPTCQRSTRHSYANIRDCRKSSDDSHRHHHLTEREVSARTNVHDRIGMCIEVIMRARRGFVDAARFALVRVNEFLREHGYEWHFSTDAIRHREQLLADDWNHAPLPDVFEEIILEKLLSGGCRG